MSFHSVKCVFLSPTIGHKGYRCLSSTKKIYISRHVIFNEKDFPFNYGFLNKREPEMIEKEVIHMFPMLPTKENETDGADKNYDMQGHLSGEVDTIHRKNLEEKVAKSADIAVHENEYEKDDETQQQTIEQIKDKKYFRLPKSIHPMMTRLKSGVIHLNLST